MSDKDIIELYRSSGTGTGVGFTVQQDLTGTGNGSISVPLGETEVVESKKTLNTLFVGFGLTVLAALGGAIQAAAPDLTQLVLASLPQIPFINAKVVGIAILAVAGWMQRRAAAQHKVSVVQALITEPSRDLKQAYEEQKKEE